MRTRQDIIALPHQDLRQRSQKVGVITEDIKQLCQDMIDAALDWEASRKHEIAVGLAAVQIDELLRVVIIRRDFEDHHDKRFQIFINPEIIKYEGEIYEDHEGCLSVKDIYGLVPRHSKVRVKALDIDGREFRVKAEGFVARLLQHEVDHLNGKLFIDHIKGNQEAFYQLTNDGKELKKLKYQDVLKKELWD